MATSYGWVGGALGSWNDPASWTGGVGVPGAEDSFWIVGETATPPAVGYSVIQGTGAAKFMSVYGDVILDGTFAVDDVLLNFYFRYTPPAGHLNIGTGSSLTGQSLTAAGDNSLVVNGGTLNLAGALNLTLGAVIFRNGATVDVGSMNLSSTRLILDSTSSLTVAAPGQGVDGAVVVGVGGLVDARSSPSLVIQSLINSGTILGGASYTGGSVQINGGINNGLVVGAHILASDTPSGFINNGTIQSGTYSLIEGVSGSGTLAVTAGGGFRVGDAVTATVDFSDGKGTLLVGMPGQVPVDTDITIANFGADDVIIFHNEITSATYTPLSAAEGRLDIITGAGAISFTFDGVYTAAPSLQFAFGTQIRQTNNQLHGDMPRPIPCFASGTRIMTSTGLVAVEDLREGDLVTAARAEAFRPIIWIGHRHVDLAAHPTPEAVMPVRVRSGAFGKNLPERDLYLSPDHAVFQEDVLIPVKHLLNGTSVARVPMQRVTYWHVELDRHDVLLAEGLPVESYLDTGDRASFQNGGTVVAMHPTFNAISRDAGGCAPLVITGPELARTQATLVQRELARAA